MFVSVSVNMFVSVSVNVFVKLLVNYNTRCLCLIASVNVFVHVSLDQFLSYLLPTCSHSANYTQDIHINAASLQAIQTIISLSIVQLVI